MGSRVELFESPYDAPASPEGLHPCEQILAALVPLSEEARLALGGKTSVRISRWPFRVGRESRAPRAQPGVAMLVERRVRAVPPVNDLCLWEPPSAAGFHISREHFAIEREGAAFVLVDRGSTCGTIVGGKARSEKGFARVLGQNGDGGRTELTDGNVIVVGCRQSPYAFRFTLDVD